MNDRHHITVAALIEREGRYLLVEERSGGRIVYNQPAGHVEMGEDLLEAVVRETWEETAWRFQPQALSGVYHWTNPENRNTYLRFCFTGSCHDHDPHQALDTGIIGTWWLTRDDLVARAGQQRSPMVLRCIDDYQAGKRYPLELYTDVSKI
ncbi:MAG: NUDIX hydrolase [Gammaproteobacteria bacterium]|jgi:8-oxo-dGTP pyrophosphatase MutT (NUDIX family)